MITFFDYLVDKDDPCFEEWFEHNHPELFNEKWKGDVKVKQTGEHANKTIAQLKKELAGLKGSGKKGEIAERVFAIRAKVFLEQEETTIPPGTILFHGSIEEFQASQLKPGGDKVLWFADNPAIAQGYIPRAGSMTIVSPSHLARPTQDKLIQNLQKYIGIEYDYDDVEWGPEGRARSFRSPKGWDHPPTEEEVAGRMEKAGWKNRSASSLPIFRSYEILIKDVLKDEFYPPEETGSGRLFIVKVKQPLKIYDITEGREGDLMSPDYHRYRMFARAEEKGYDGVKIHDFAQIHNWGNIGHVSIGVFKNALDKLTWTTVSAKHVDWDKARWKKLMTPEYEEYLQRRK
jgi:hypothetical protein